MIDFQSLILLFVNNFSYLGMFLLLVIISLIPIPEELVLLLIGYFTSYGFADIEKVIVVCFLGALVGDNILFFLSRHGSGYVIKIKKILTRNLFIKHENFIKRHIGLSIFLLRFIIGLRFLGPITAATVKIKWIKFQFYNFVALLIFVPLFIIIGFQFNKIISFIISKIMLFKEVFLSVIFLMFFADIVYLVRKKIKKLREKKN